MPEQSLEHDEEYCRIILTPLEVCRHYKPRFGHGEAMTLEEFRALYRSDPFYSWLGLDSPLLYAAHKAAGGMTSLYRQIGIGCQRLFQKVLMDTLALSEEQSKWSYEVIRSGGKKQTLSLDGRIPLNDIRDDTRRLTLVEWLESACDAVGITTRKPFQGAVFEVRQGYKSKDSKRQNADIANAAAAYSESYLPVLLLLSTQIDDDIAERYQSARWLILRGRTVGTALDSSYEFCRRILGYDLAQFFQRNSTTFRTEIEGILEALLR